MTRWIVGLVAFLLVVPRPSAAQTPAEMARTAAYLEAMQNPDGGFGGKPGDRSSLGATSSAVRQLKSVGGSVPDISSCMAYLKGCFDPKAGGFAPSPGGPPDVHTTASGLMALGELKIATDEIVNACIGYFGKEVKTFEEIRIAVAGLEAVKKPSPDFPRWIEQVNSDRNSDGTWGSAGGQARATGSAAAALLRMGVDLDKKDAVVSTLKAAQRPDGGWSRDGTASDLETTYRIARALFMMKEAPDLDRLRSYLAGHRREDGGYASKPGGSDGGGTYFCTTVERWVRLMSGEPAVVETAGFVPLFDGKSLDGWEGDTSLWSAKDGVLVGTSPGLKHNDFLATTKDYEDFILKFTFRMTGGESANSGVQFRSVRVPNHEMSGYQADIGQGYWGCLYDESRRNKVLVQASDRAKAAVRPGKWNEYVIRCMGNHITMTLNGVPSVDYVEKDADIARTGKIAVQIHAGGPMTIEFKDMYIQPLPIADDSAEDVPDFHLRKPKDGERKYVVYLPQGFDKSKAYPIVLFLHGAGERGDDPVRAAQVGLGAIIAKTPEQFPIIAVFPQAKRTWEAGSDDAKFAMAALDDAMSRYRTEPGRVYLTGLSMGGHGTWANAAANPGKFAAVVPVCGFGDPKIAESLKNTPIWTLVGDDDSARILGGTRSLVQAVKEAGGSPKWTEFRGIGHNSWDRAYSDPRVIRWMLSQAGK